LRRGFNISRAEVIKQFVIFKILWYKLFRKFK